MVRTLSLAALLLAAGGCFSVVSMTPTAGAIINTSVATTGLVVRGNLAEGSSAIVGGAPGAGVDIAGNGLGPLPVESPFAPNSSPMRRPAFVSMVVRVAASTAFG